jgi:4-aminobutyrate aminotransferase/diaminobutyrate-pyruvate transaminase/4-aminobutyrate aminotransferase/(S)-3-amino-2-methylpropionate transaminase
MSMAGAAYSLTPTDVPKVETQYRRIATEIPPRGAVERIRRLRSAEPVSMSGQPPVLWDHAEGLCVFDEWGNRWLDWSSGVLVASAGHSRPEVVDAVVRQAQHNLLHNYCFPSEPRRRLVEKLVALAPAPLKKVFLLTTGAETTECAIKLALTHGQSVGGEKKNVFVTFDGAFHGRTLGSQLAGGIPSLKTWITFDPGNFVQVPFPGDYRCTDRSFAAFEQALAEKGVEPQHVAGVMSETYQGGGASFMPVEFADALRTWCDANDVVLIFDEVQAGFGRTGTMFGFEHYCVVPDLACFGKGISSSLPISAVLGKPELMDQYPPGSMTSTHTGSPLCCAAALANIEIIERDKLHENAAAMGAVLLDGLHGLCGKYGVCGDAYGKGLVAGVYIVKPGTKDPDGELATALVERCMQKGLLMFSPVGTGGALLKIAPPLSSTQDAIEEGVAVLDEAIGEVLTERGA